MDIQKLLQEAEAMQKALLVAQSELEKIEVTGASGNGSVQVRMTGHGELKDIKIKKEVVNPNDIETLEDLIISAIKDANSKALALSQEKLGKLTGGKGLPPL